MALVDNFFLDNIIFSSANLYIIKKDVYARGIQKNISDKFILIDYIHFVELTVKNKKQIIW
ncbi:sulfurtransferase complex subunit TusB [Buchnera aphidicola]|uniref:sulfurtransferase complex subunit TusB n=1 Tax=Buchnera aphidicola TaxID=9 RepID=UPI0021C2B7CF|nr:sulfurtransferase complex subunit TusB [Buchnera aphidicola]